MFRSKDEADYYSWVSEMGRRGVPFELASQQWHENKLYEAEALERNKRNKQQEIYERNHLAELSVDQAWDGIKYKIPKKKMG